MRCDRGGRKVDSRFIDCRHIDCRHLAKCDSCRHVDCRLIARLSPIITPPPHPQKKCQNTLLQSGFQMLGWLGLVISFVMQLEMIHLGTHNTPHFCNISCFTSAVLLRGRQPGCLAEPGPSVNIDAWQPRSST